MSVIYQIKCDGYVLYDPRDEELIVQNPKCKLSVNTTGEASFSIYATHPFYGHLQKMKSVFEILQDGDVIFRGRMTNDTLDFNNMKQVDIEGAMAYFNDSVVRPFAFPDDFLSNSDYIAAADSGNVIEFFLGWLIDNHNSQVKDFQKFKLGNVTVSDQNNYIVRSNEDYASTWDTLKTRLFESTHKGYLCIRYEDDGNYIDYLANFELTNTQRITFGENLLDITKESDAAETYTAIIPLGMKHNEIDKDSEDSSRLTIEELSDGDVTSDIVKSGDTLYSKSAVDKYGFIYAPTSETTWDDVTDATNLKTNGTEYLARKSVMLSNTITIKAIDLNFNDKNIESFRIYRNIQFYSIPHSLSGSYSLTTLDIDIQNPQNTVITLGDVSLSLTDKNASDKQAIMNQVETVKKQSNSQMADIKKVFSFLPQGLGIALGKVAELQNVFDVGFQTRFLGGILHQILEPNTDLNDVRTPNTYVGANTSTYAYLNCPISSGTFTLVVDGAGADGQVKQRLTSCRKSDARTFERIYYQSSWGEWVCVSDFAGTLLASPGMYMTSGHTVTLAEPVSRQRTGIVLVFSEYVNGAVSDQSFSCRFIPKMMVSKHNGKAQCIQLSTSNLEYFATKYLYISDDKITGHDNNSMTGTGSGITYTNNRFVLRYVIGV